MKQQGGGDVVGQIAHDLQPAAQGGEVELEGVGRVDVQMILAGEARFQAGHQIAVDLDDVETAARRQQEAGQGALAGADFHHVVLG